MTTLRISRMHYPVTALGPGRRLGLWLQGCTIGCRGCVSLDTWDGDGGTVADVGAVVSTAAALARNIDGITITGGEPFEQPEGLGELLRGLRECLPNADLLCYSGLPMRRLRSDHADLLALLDAVIPEPYVARRPDGGAWRGSDNQPLVLQTERARSRFAQPPPAAALQVAEQDGALYLIGIPRRGDLDRLDAALSARGVKLQESSWR